MKDHVILKCIIIGPFNYANQNGHPKILIRRIWGKRAREGAI